MAERLAKFMARSGVCSRRDAEDLIKQKRVTVNGEIIDTPAFKVEGSEKILLDGEKLPEIEQTRLWLYHKPAGLLTTQGKFKASALIILIFSCSLTNILAFLAAKDVSLSTKVTVAAPRDNASSPNAPVPAKMSAKCTAL